MWRNPIRALRQRSGLTQAALAEEGGTSQPTIAAYETGDRVPNLRTAERLAEAAGLEMTIDFGPPLTREDRRSLALHEALVARLQDDPAPVIERARRTLARMREAHGSEVSLLNHWSRLLELPVEHLADVLLDPRPFARDLRQCTPFAGILSQVDRAEVYRRFAEAEHARRIHSKGRGR
ncbi:MAG: helix-turn-helix transcriptional regulator [Gemmatimonadota bacterium]